jgi:hypothetical protein
LKTFFGAPLMDLLLNQRSPSGIFQLGDPRLGWFEPDNTGVCSNSEGVDVGFRFELTQF